nr:sugar phosphate isomerase/epimerase family protein [Variibacter gotjawalensis]
MSLCNEVISGGRSFAEQCDLAAKLGYAGLEIAPFTLGTEPHRLKKPEIEVARKAMSDAGLRCSGLHWLLVKPDGLSITSDEAGTMKTTRDVMKRLVDLCAELGGEYLVHGSPFQRRLPDKNADAARERAVEAWTLAGEHAARANVIYCIEPLAPPDANFVNTIAEAAEIVRAADNPALRTMMDASAITAHEKQSLEQLAAEWLPTGLIAHIQVNDRNRRGPGQGDVKFAPFFRELRTQNYNGWIAMEPFDYVPDGAGSAARAIGYIQGIIEGTA